MKTLPFSSPAMPRLPLLAALCLLLSLLAPAQAQNRLTCNASRACLYTVTKPAPLSLYTRKTAIIPPARQVQKPARPYKPFVANVRLKTYPRTFQPAPAYNARASGAFTPSRANTRPFH